MTCPPPLCLHESSTPHLHFPNYAKHELISIVAKTQIPEKIPTTTEKETYDLWPRFCGAVHDALARSAARALPTFSQACRNLWPRFTAPIIAGNYQAKDFTRLLIAARPHFQDESILDPGIIRERHNLNGNATAVASGSPFRTGRPGTAGTTPSRAAATPRRGLGTPTTITRGRSFALPSIKTVDLVPLPTTARMILVAAYLASHNQSRHDSTLFCTQYTGRKRRRGGMVGAGRRSKHRKIARKLLGAHAFVMERMLAIFVALRNDWAPHLGASILDGDVGMALSTLASLRLLLKVGAAGGDPLDRGGKWRVNVGWEVIRGVGRSIGVEVEDWLID